MIKELRELNSHMGDDERRYTFLSAKCYMIHRSLGAGIDYASLTALLIERCPLLIIVHIILNCSLALKQCRVSAGIIMPSPSFSVFFFLIFDLYLGHAVYDLYVVVKGRGLFRQLFTLVKRCGSHTARSFLDDRPAQIESGTYSMIPTMMCGAPFFNSVPGVLSII
ncbi:MAG: hypothetical protein JWO03_2272 [Bacteroidetes bacterium]|nr:hypothetical protein [Bacteroidota bacterium]